MSALESLEQFEFHQTLDAVTGVGIIFFSSQECQSCRYWEQLLGQFIEKHPDIKVFRIDAALDQALTEEFDVFHLPSLFVYNNGKYHAAIHSEARLESLEVAINKLLESPAEEMP